MCMCIMEVRCRLVCKAHTLTQHSAAPWTSIKPTSLCVQGSHANALLLPFYCGPLLVLVLLQDSAEAAGFDAIAAVTEVSP